MIKNRNAFLSFIQGAMTCLSILIDRASSYKYIQADLFCQGVLQHFNTLRTLAFTANTSFSPRSPKREFQAQFSVIESFTVREGYSTVR